MATLQVPSMFFTALRLIERAVAYAQGKGYGSTTIRQEVTLVTKILNSQPALAIDIGGNVGKYSQELRRRFPACEIHIFEPAEKNISILKNAFSSDADTTITPSAVSDKTGSAALFANEPGSGLASLTKRRLDHFSIPFEHKESVNLIRFDEYWEQKLHNRTIDIAKLDIEGHELDALNGFGKALVKTKLFQIEFGGCNIDTRTYFQDFYYFFKDHGFELHRITPFGLNKIEKYREADEFFSTTNFLALNKNFKI